MTNQDIPKMALNLSHEGYALARVGVLFHSSTRTQ